MGHSGLVSDGSALVWHWCPLRIQLPHELNRADITIPTLSVGSGGVGDSSSVPRSWWAGCLGTEGAARGMFRRQLWVPSTLCPHLKENLGNPTPNGPFRKPQVGSSLSEGGLVASVSLPLKGLYLPYCGNVNPQTACCSYFKVFQKISFLICICIQSSLIAVMFSFDF